MINPNFNPDTNADSILFVKASGSISDEVIQDLLLENGKNIAELLDGQEKTKQSK